MSDEGAEGGEGGRYRLPRTARITASEEIRALFRRGKRKRTRHLDVFVAASPVSRSRWGVVVPKHRHKIVERNRVKRRLREIGRTEVLPRPEEGAQRLDLLVRARPEAYDAPFAALRDELVQLTEELCSGR